MANPTSRYGIQNDDLRQAALALQLGQGIADRINSVETTVFIVRAEDWADYQVDDYVAVPLKPVRALGQSKTDFDPNNPTTRNYPMDFIYAIIYRAVGLLLTSEYSENMPNASDYGHAALQLSETHIQAFRDSPTIRVGSGRMRHPNPFIPPQIAPRKPTGNPPDVYNK